MVLLLVIALAIALLAPRYGVDSRFRDPEPFFGDWRPRRRDVSR